jgi:hypothetical protein
MIYKAYLIHMIILKKLRKKLFVMTRQFGPPTFLITFYIQ